jgi:hypothetical protein
MTKPRGGEQSFGQLIKAPLKAGSDTGESKSPPDTGGLSFNV